MSNISIARRMLNRIQQLVIDGERAEAAYAIVRLCDRAERMQRSEDRRRVAIVLINFAMAMHEAVYWTNLWRLWNRQEGLLGKEGWFLDQRLAVERAMQAGARLQKALNEASATLDLAQEVDERAD